MNKLTILHVFFSVCLFGQVMGQVPFGRLDTLTNLKTTLGHQPPVYVWTPSAYDASKPCQVVYMFDGHMLFDGRTTWNKQEWTVDETVESLMSQQLVQPTIVVGLGIQDSLRHGQYSPEKPFRQLSEQQQQKALNSKRSSGQNYFRKKEVISDDYLQWLVNTVKPYIDKNYSTLADPAHTYIGGASMGGLMAMYTILEYPQVFEKAFCLSTNWPLTEAEQDMGFMEAWKNYLVTRLPLLNKHFIYMDYGAHGKDATYANYQKDMDNCLRTHGFNQFETKHYPMHDHSEAAWAARINEVLLRMFLH